MTDFEKQIQDGKRFIQGHPEGAPTGKPLNPPSFPSLKEAIERAEARENLKSEK